ncbi:Protein SLG1 [Microsporum audouinii]
MAVAFLLSASISCVEANLDESLKGCYKGPGSLKDMGPTKYQSTGACRELCKKTQNAVFALHDVDSCSCGDKYPPEVLKAASTDKTCILVSCPGFGDDRCGGKKSYAVYLTGLVDDPATEGGADDGDATKTSSPPQATITEGGHTVVVTSKPSGSGPNKAGIAAGVVVGVVAIGAIIGGIFFFLKYRKRQRVVDEYRRNATINNFVGGGKPSYSQGSADSRLDPSMTSQRRQSNGSIADDQDFSRRVLKVTNPDGHY